ncbi:sulfite exporter TauE/SafE family protein [Fusibacter sp. JL216-2]|uniref:sulfite exporter TauE/SafE family protein n=1 Tax=Fusibacter sp. JL216-2 TaxID=3071453 RepID=UPI003D348B79
MTILLGFLVVFASSCVQGMTSFGFSLLAVPLLGLFMPLDIIVPMLVLYSLLMNFMILIKLKAKPDFKAIGIILTTGIIATPLGAKLLMTANPDILKFVVGIIIFVSGIFMYKGYKVKMGSKTLSFLTTGFMSGLLNGSISMSGPPVILFMTNEGVEKKQFRTNLTSYFFILNIITVGIFYLNGQLGAQVIKTSVYLLPALVIGVLSGVSLGNKANEDKFRTFTIMMIMAMGLLSIVSSNLQSWIK